jgi:membrane-associated protein
MPHLDLLPIIQAVGYPGVSAIIFLESGVVVGFFLPGASLLFTAGLLASQGVFDVRILIPLVTIAAILGDNAGYWFGSKIGWRLFIRPDSRFFKHKHLERTKRFYEKYGSRTILLARFVPIIRTFAPIVAGIVKMNYRAFVIYNIIGAFLWATGVTFLGYYLGSTFPMVETYLGPIILLIVTVSVIPIARDFYREIFTKETIQDPL